MAVDTASAVVANAPMAQTAMSGLSSGEASARLNKDWPNAMPDTSAHPLRDALIKFWAPIPWLLEASVVLELVLHKYFEAAVMAGLLVFNAFLVYLQEGRAQATLAALKGRLALNASVRRDGGWKTVPATQLVVGDLISCHWVAWLLPMSTLWMVRSCLTSPCSRGSLCR